MLTIEGVTKRFGAFVAVNDMSFDVRAGEILALVGESGSGKTTVGRIIAGLEEKSSGSIALKGESLPNRYGKTEFRIWGKRIQMIFQNPLGALNPFFSSADVLAEALRFSGKKVTDVAIDHWLAEVGLQSFHRHRLPHQLSGGQRQRLVIARALCMEPDLIVCDEPVSALDVSIQAQILALLKRLRDEKGVSLLFITHDLNVVRQIADRVLVMNRGVRVELADTATVFENPSHDYTRQLLEACPVPEYQAKQQETSA